MVTFGLTVVAVCSRDAIGSDQFKVGCTLSDNQPSFSIIDLGVSETHLLFQAHLIFILNINILAGKLPAGTFDIAKKSVIILKTNRTIQYLFNVILHI